MAVIAIVDYDMGNVGSIRNMLKKIGVAAEVTCDPDRIAAAEKLILPGVGAFDAGIENLRRSGLVPLLEQRVREARVPVLGICLGMQLMTHGSEEGRLEGLGWIDACTLRFRPDDPALKVPHMGWNRVFAARPSALTDDLPDEPRFYFVHSYHVRCASEDDVVLTTPYGGLFHSAFRRDNVWGVQFHPEKSHKFGMRLLASFAQRCGSC
jgi:glutamine amidotransferase